LDVSQWLISTFRESDEYGYKKSESWNWQSESPG
jgi:hypothetical protein